MKKIMILLTLALLVSSGFSAPPVKIIFDTDMALDVDDAGTLAMLNRLQTLGECEILGVMVSSGSRCYDGYWGAACVDAINTYYNRAGIPIGIYKGCHTIPDRVSNYSKEVADSFPHGLQNGTFAPDATSLYRRILAGETDHSVVIVTTGYLNNLAELLKSGPDEFSNLSGPELVRKKVSSWSCMGGQYPQGNEEFNFNTYAHETAYVLENWPAEAIFGGFEVGWEVKTGGEFDDIYTPGGNPVAMAFKYYTSGDDRYSWDEISALVAVRGPAPYFDLVRGSNRLEVSDPQTLGGRISSRNLWTDDPSGDHYYLVMKSDPKDIAKELNDLMYAPPE